MRNQTFFEWIHLYADMSWVSYSSIPEEAEKQVFANKVKASSVVLHGPLISLEDFIPLAVKSGADIHANDEYALRVASYYGHAAAVECLLKAGANVHALDDFALRWASSRGHAAAVECLLKAGADVHALDDYALRWASSRGHVAVVEYGHAAVLSQTLVSILKICKNVVNSLNSVFNRISTTPSHQVS